MDRRIALVAVVAVLAGCGAFAPTGGETPRETVTAQPVPTSSDASAAVDAGQSLPPGIAANGTVSAAALARAHSEALGDRSLTWAVEYERRDLLEGVVTTDVRKRLRVAADGSYLLATRRSDDRSRRLYADETGAYTRTLVDGVATSRYREGAVDYRHHLTTRRALHVYLESEDATVSQVRRDGQTYVRVHVTDPASSVGDIHPSQRLGNYTATAYVTPEGLVRTLVVDYDYAFGDDRIRISLRSDYDRVGQTTVERPAWVDAMAQNVTASNPTTATADPSRVPPPTVNATASG